MTDMPTVTARDLARNTAHVLGEVERTRRPSLVLRNGRPVAALIAVDESTLEDFILANAPEYAASMVEADADLAAGRVVEHAQLFAELDAEATDENVARIG